MMHIMCSIHDMALMLIKHTGYVLFMVWPNVMSVHVSLLVSTRP
jgi:hypothetical protein